MGDLDPTYGWAATMSSKSTMNLSLLFLINSFTSGKLFKFIEFWFWVPDLLSSGTWTLFSLVSSCIWLFSSLCCSVCLLLSVVSVAQDYFKELTDQDVRKRLYDEQKNQIEQDMAPFGFVTDGMDDESFVDSEGDRWHTDEYGDKGGGMNYMWDYM